MNLASIITITWLAPLMGAIISGIFGLESAIKIATI